MDAGMPISLLPIYWPMMLMLPQCCALLRSAPRLPLPFSVFLSLFFSSALFLVYSCFFFIPFSFFLSFLFLFHFFFFSSLYFIFFSLPSPPLPVSSALISFLLISHSSKKEGRKKEKTEGLREGAREGEVVMSQTGIDRDRRPLRCSEESESSYEGKASRSFGANDFFPCFMRIFEYRAKIRICLCGC